VDLEYFFDLWILESGINCLTYELMNPKDLLIPPIQDFCGFNIMECEKTNVNSLFHTTIGIHCLEYYI